MSLLQAGFGSSGDDYTIDDSLRLRSSASAYLNRTPSSTSDRTEWTWSGWVKKGPNATNLSLFSADHAGGSNAYLSMLINSSDEFQIFEYTGSAYTLRLATNALFRDPSAWYHFVCAVDTDQGTDTNRIKLYVNGVQQTSLRLSTYPSSGHTTYVNVSGNLHAVGATVGASTSPDRYLDGYLTEVNFIDGQQLTPSDFGEYDDNGTWKPLAYTGTYGNNGFYLPMKPTTQATGFNTVLYAGDGGTQSINGVGFSSSPDLIWIKGRNDAQYHVLQNSVTGAGKTLFSNTTTAETGNAGDFISSFDSDGFTVNNTYAGGTNNTVNGSGKTYVAWCWDAGSGSAGTNTEGSINSTVKANPATGFSIVSYTGNGTSAGARTVGHGLGVTPSMVIVKSRGAARGWETWFKGFSSSEYIFLNTTAAKASFSNSWGSTPTSTVFGVNNSTNSNNASEAYIAYCFAEVAGYSKIDTYSGNGSAGNSVTGLGFQPAWLMIKCSSTASTPWVMYDNTREPDNDNNDLVLQADNSSAELDGGGTTRAVTFDSDGFTLDTTYGGNNGSGRTYIYMAFADTADARFNFDASGNQNNWEPNNINSNAESETTYDLMKDTPSLVDENAGNFCTLSPISKHASSSTTNGNLTGTTTTASDQMILSTFAVSSGKWYWEVVSSAQAAAGCMVGVRASYLGFAGSLLSATDGYAYYPNGSKYSGAGGASYGASWTNGDVIGIALDLDNGTIAFYKNNASQGTAFTGISGTYTPGVSNGGATSSSTFVINFGQRPFEYTPPSGFLKLNTFNLPDSTIEKGDDYFNAVLYTGNNASGRNIPTGFPGGWTWIKNRNAANSHTLSDVVRGDGKTLFTNATNAEVDYGSNGIDLVSDGFDVTHSATNNLFNVTGRTYVAWNWRAGSTATNSAGANGASIASTYSANTTSGFSVVSWSGNSTNGATVGHLLGAAPSLIITKCRSHATSWVVGIGGISGFGVNDYLTLQTTSQKNASSTFYQAYSANTFQVGVSSADEMNKTGRTYISYCFAEVPGYSAFGSYTGNGSADGTFVHLNFRPSWLLIKQTNGGSFNWNLIDTSRSPFNTADDLLAPNANNAEAVSGFVDAVSNGFKCRNSSAYVNGSGSTYIYMAFAENPFKNSNAR